MIKLCIQCNINPVKRKNNIFCSIYCQHQTQKRVPKICKQCQVNKVGRPDKSDFCSHKCAGFARIGFKNSEETKIKMSNSAKKAGTGRWNKDRKYSEEHCRNIGKTKIGNKNAVGIKLSKEHKETLRQLAKLPKSQEIKDKLRKANLGKKQSIETRLKMSEGRKGDKHWNWQDGKTSENLIIRHSFEMKLWRKACMERDDFTDQKTGQRGGELVVHHINNFSSFPELRTSIENGITLSKESHIEFHKIYGKRNNTRIQLKEFLGIKKQELKSPYFKELIKTI